MEIIKNKALVYACNDNYSKLAGVSLLSFLKNYTADDFIVYILDDSISIENKEKLVQTAETFEIELFFYDVSDCIKYLSENNVTAYDNSVGNGMTTYARLFLDRILPRNIEKCLYLDCDTLILDDCKDIWNVSVTDKPIALAFDCLRNEYKKEIGLDYNRKYFNSGVMLFDLPLWKEKKCFDKIINHVKTVRNSYPLVDQDLINCALHDEIAVLPQQYNFESQLFLYKYRRLLKIYRLHPDYWNSETDFEYAKKNIKICHFCGNTYGRPWYKNSKHPIKKVYDSYYQQSPWVDEEQLLYNLPIAYKLQYLCTKPLLRWTELFWGIIQRFFVWKTYKV